MKKNESIEFLDSLKAKLASMSQEEFNEIEKAKGLDTKALYVSNSESKNDFEIIFSTDLSEAEFITNSYEYALFMPNEYTLSSCENITDLENDNLSAAA